MAGRAKRDAITPEQRERIVEACARESRRNVARAMGVSVGTVNNIMRAARGAAAAEHSWRLDDDRADVVVIGREHATAHGRCNTFTCAGCGIRLAWLPMPDGDVAAAHGIALEVLVPGRPPKRCEGPRHA